MAMIIAYCWLVRCASGSAMGEIINSKYAIFLPVAWIVSFYNARVEAELSALAPGFLARFIRYAERMELFGPDLGMPHTKAMGEGLFELRVKSPEGIARVFYCTIVAQRIVFLHHFVKKTDKTPARELEVARNRLKDLK